MESHAKSIQGSNMSEESIKYEIAQLNVRGDQLHDLTAKLVEVCEKLNQRLDNQAEAIKLTKDLIILTTQQSI